MTDYPSLENPSFAEVFGLSVCEMCAKIPRTETAIIDWFAQSCQREITWSRMLVPAVPIGGPCRRWEDAVDALVAAWVGVRYLDGTAEAYCDATAAIWIPGKLSRN